MISEKAKGGRFAVHDGQGQEIASFGKIRANLAVKAMERKRHHSTSQRTARRSYRYDLLDVSRLPLLGMTRQERSVLSAREIVVEEPNGIPVGYIVRESANTLKATTTLQGGAATAAGIASLGFKGIHSIAGSTALSGLASGLGAAEDMLRQGRVRYGLEVASQRLATVRGSANGRWGFVITDTHGSEIAKLTKDWDGWSAAGLKPDTHYVVHVRQHLQDPLRSLVVAAAIFIHVLEEKA